MTVRTGCKLPLPFQKLGSRSVWNFHNSYVLQRLTYWGEQSCPFSRILCNTLQEPICLLIQLLLFPLHHGVKGAILKVARIAGGLSGGNPDSAFLALFCTFLRTFFPLFSTQNLSRIGGNLVGIWTVIFEHFSEDFSPTFLDSKPFSDGWWIIWWESELESVFVQVAKCIWPNC